MKPSQASGWLRRLLLDEGFDFDSPNPAVGWRAFKRFAQVPVKGVGDGILWQLGCYDFTGTTLFYLDYVRQFEFTVGGEFDHFEHLHLEFTSPPTVDLVGLKRDCWAFEFASLTHYFSDVESYPEFQLALSHPAWRVELFQEVV